jgi:phage terminase small subunit
VGRNCAAVADNAASGFYFRMSVSIVFAGNTTSGQPQRHQPSPARFNYFRTLYRSTELSGGNQVGKLTPKQKRFVVEYLVDLNATKAAERAGYSKHTANEQGSRLLANVSVSAAIDAKQEKRLQKMEISGERVLNELALLGFSNMLDYISVGENGAARVDLSKLTRDQAAAMQEITVEEFTERTGEDEDGKPTLENVRRTKFKLADKRGALVDLGRHLKLFTDRLQVEDERQLEIQDVKEKLRARLLKRVAS